MATPSIVRSWDPFSLLGRSAYREPGRSVPTRSFPAANVWSGPQGLVVTFELPGLDPDSIDVTVEPDVLVVKGRRDPEVEPEGGSTLRTERASGPFERALRLPCRVDPDGTAARYQRGVLEVLMPRSTTDEPRRVSVAAV